ncbi:MAG TPA: hypothetical protein VIC51_01020 [Psychromonas sp.]
MKIKYKNLLISTHGDKCRLQTGRVIRWRSINQVAIHCIEDQYTLEFDDLFIDLSKQEAEHISEMIGKKIAFIED